MTVAYGEWPSPITPELVVAASVSLGEVHLDGGDVFWSELRPDEGGRVQVVRRKPGGTTDDLLPHGFSARTRVHEYGGGAWFVDDGELYFSNWDDQRLYRMDIDEPASAPVPVTPVPPADHALRYADMRLLGHHVVCVRERHDPGGDVVNEIVSIDTTGGHDTQVLVTGHDFVSNPRLSPDGHELVWIQWDHPNMPWDSTELCSAAISLVDDSLVLGQPIVVAGGAAESVIQPLFRDDGLLHFLSDRTGWWNAYALDGAETVAVTDLDAEIGTPQWVFGMSRYGFLGDGRMVFAYASEGLDHLAVSSADGTVTDLGLPYTEIASVTVGETSAFFVGAGFDREAAVVEVAIGGTRQDPVAGETRVLRPARDIGLDGDWFSVAQPVSFPSGPGGSRTAHALYYPPTNPDVDRPDDDAPPLLVVIHGGPTGMARARLDLAKQFWTSRGFAVVDVNYGGSTGFGRPYRELLQDAWGVVDVEDCVAAATWLADQRLADADRLCIRGGSAGGFTVLAALAGTDVFAAGACSYGVADLSALAEDTHKFESRYLDGLVGPYPEAKAVYDERSPINHVADLDSPLIVFQGLEDEIVPPNQSEMIVEALEAKGVPVAYLAFEGEQHGFRKSETVITVLGSELAFYGRVLGFTPAGGLPEPAIANL